MLTRLKVSGFKNLLDVDVRFGPFTCIAGSNGIGKSNLFDAIVFLSHLADKPLLEAALLVRDPGGRATDMDNLFFKARHYVHPAIEFEAEMIVPKEGEDELGQHAVATSTFLRYTLHLGLRRHSGNGSAGGLELLKEELDYIPVSQSSKHLRFPHSASLWRRSVVESKRRTATFISTESDEDGKKLVKLHQDGGGGRPQARIASRLPRTVLSAANAAEAQTVLLARREMQSWRLLQLEPTSLRRPDEFAAPQHLGADGSHLAATLSRLGRESGGGPRGVLQEQEGEAAGSPLMDGDACARVANRLGELLGDVSGVYVDRDSKREILTVMAKDRHGTSHPARSLSDGTLRFLALAVLAEDPLDRGLVCMEEPENGIHPARIPAMLRMLGDIAVDAQERTGPDNPLRQVIVNTHSPAVVAAVSEEDLLVAEPNQVVLPDGGRGATFRLAPLSGTWRAKPDSSGTSVHSCALGSLGWYLNPFPSPGSSPSELASPSRGSRRLRSAQSGHRVGDRPDLLPFLFPETRE